MPVERGEMTHSGLFVRQKMKKVRVGGEEEGEGGGRRAGVLSDTTGERRQAKTGGRSKSRN